MTLPLLTDTIDCDCEVCISACRNKPGWFLPEEIKPAADLLGMTEQDFFNQFLAVDYYGNPEHFDFVVAPATVNIESGKEYPLDPTGKCVFLTEDNKCKIHAAKPYECKQYDHRKKLDDAARESHKKVSEAWISHKEKITQLLGREPEVQLPNPLELMLFMLKTLSNS